MSSLWCSLEPQHLQVRAWWTQFQGDTRSRISFPPIASDLVLVSTNVHHDASRRISFVGTCGWRNRHVKSAKKHDMCAKTRSPLLPFILQTLLHLRRRATTLPPTLIVRLQQNTLLWILAQ